MIAKLIEKIKQTNAPICVGLDPLISHIPDYILEEKIKKYGKTTKAIGEAFYDFNKEIIDKTYDLIPAVKPQIAMYEEFGIEGMISYQKTVEYAKEKELLVIGDAKRGDIGSTSLSYAKAHIGVSEILGEKVIGFDTDFVTVNPYLGTDGVKPFIDVCNSENKGIFVLVKTSNPSSGEFQDQLIDGTPLYELVAKKTCEWGAMSMDGNYSNVGAVVGATYPKMSAILREKRRSTRVLLTPLRLPVRHGLSSVKELVNNLADTIFRIRADGVDTNTLSPPTRKRIHVRVNPDHSVLRLDVLILKELLQSPTERRTHSHTRNTQ